MSTIKVFALGGLDKKSNDLTRSTDKASDMVNLEYDTQSTIKKRNGFAQALIDAGDMPAGTVQDMIYYAAKDEIILFMLQNDGFTHILSLSRNGASWISRQIYGPLIYSASQFPVSHCENQSNLYFTFIDQNTPVFKYDGSYVTLAGLFTPFNTYDAYNKIIIEDPANGVFIGTPSANTYYLRIFAKYTDYNGNITYGPYIQSINTFAIGQNIKLNSFTYLNGYAKYLLITTGGSGLVLNSGSRTVTTSAGYHNYFSGDKFLLIANSFYITITSPSNRTTVQLVVESSTATSVTFTAASLAGISVTFGVSITDYNIDRRCEFVIAISKTAATGYYLTKAPLAVDEDLYVVDTKSLTYAFTVNDTNFTTKQLIPFEDVYDSTTLKVLPPICKYLSSFGDQIVYGNISSVYNLDNHPTIYDNNDLIIYSDSSTGDGPENISEANRQKIGETWDGVITGMRRCNDSFVVFKNNGVFALDGSLIQGQYSLRKINTNFIGCTCNNSILQADEGLYFQSHNGIYFTNAIGVEKLTYEMDSLFQSGAYTDTRSVRLKKKQKSIFYVNTLLGYMKYDNSTPPLLVPDTSPKVVVIDYYYNQVYIWSLDKQPSLGFIEDPSGNVYFTDGLKLYLFNDLYSDNGVAISSLYSTTWHHAGEPALNKKWLSIRTWGLTSDAFTATIKTEGDWQVGTYLTNDSSVYGVTTQTDFKMLNMQTKKALRVNFSNSTDAENMVLTGYELTYQEFNSVDKN